MTQFPIRQAAVIGSGTMGSGIAALLAGVGLPVTLLDIAPERLAPEEAQAGLSLESRAVRNRIVTAGLERIKHARPPALFMPGDAGLITLGNLVDDFDQLSRADWIVEAIIEDLDAKRALFARLEAVLGPNAIVSSNTSGLPMRDLVAGRGERFRRRFIGTHFFNPVRYLHLLELIPTSDTDPAVLATMRSFGECVLGKGVVVCKDTPNFIGNRVGLATIGFRMWHGLENGYSIEEIDALAGPHLGYPKTGVFRLLDLTGIDVTADVEKNFARVLPDEPTWNRGQSGALVGQMVARGWLGNKTGVGFYKEVRGADGRRDFWVLDARTLEHVPPTHPRFESIDATRAIPELGARLRAMLAHDDRAARFAWHDLAFQFAYCSSKVPEVSDDLASIDNAMKWGYAQELGPFEKWDALGVADTVARMEAGGYAPAPWVKAMLAAGHESFYAFRAGRLVQYSPAAQGYVPVEQSEQALSVAGLRRRGAEVERNADASLLDLGDGVALLEYHSKANTLTADIAAMSRRALERLAHDFDALVIGNQGPLFCGGANLDPQSLLAGAEPPAVLVERLTHEFQRLMQAIRFSPKPIVAAPFDRTLGGGAETCLAASRSVASAELAMGLVEIGLGLLPAGGGCKELLRRVVNPVMRNEQADPFAAIQPVFNQIGLARVSSSAREARAMGFLAPTDLIVMNRRHLLGEAKREARRMADAGYQPPRPETVYAAGRDVLAGLQMQLFQMLEGGFISEHDRLVATRLAWVLCGGDLSAPAWVDEQYLLDLEREAFVFLIQQPKTLERIGHMLRTGKPLRN